jgi:hypothetical protein
MAGRLAAKINQGEAEGAWGIPSSVSRPFPQLTAHRTIAERSNAAQPPGTASDTAEIQARSVASDRSLAVDSATVVPVLVSSAVGS